MSSNTDSRSLMNPGEGAFEALFHSIPDAVIFADTQRRIRYVNPAAERLFGYTAQELIGNTTEMLYRSSEDFWEQGEKRFHPSAYAPQVYEMHYRRKSGEVFVGETSGVPVTNAAGETIGLAGVVRDPRQQFAELENVTRGIKRERDFSSALLDTIGSVVVVMNRSGDIVRFNQAAQDVTGYGSEEALGRRVWDFLLAEDEREGVEAVFARLTAGDFPSKYENDWVNRDGERRRIAWSNSALVDESGEVEYVIATGIDITEQRRAERNLARVETEWNKAIEFFADPIYLVGLDDRVIRANHAFYAMIGQTPAQVIGRDIAAIMHPDGEAVPCPVCSARRRREDADIILEKEHPDNPVGSPIDVTLRVIRDEQNEPVGILMGMRDLTRQRQIEEELRQHRDHLEDLVQQRTSALESVNRELESFSYSVSHDLRAPLRSIDGFSHALLEDFGGVLDETGQGYLHRVRKASQRMGQLIDDLLQLSRVGRDAMEGREINLSKMANSVIRLLREGDPGRDMDVYVEEGLSCYGDSRLLRLLLENLLGNAWKFTAPRAVGEISFGAEQQDGKTEFFVRDNGIGFDMKYAGKLFGPFQRLHSDTDFAGTGIGLATVYRIVKRHEGDIRAEAAPNKGATFYFSLDLKPDDAPDREQGTEA